VPHGYSQRTPKKMKAAALRGALSDRAREGRVHVLSSLVQGDAPSTKTAAAAVAAVSSAKKILVVVSREDEIGWRSLRNVGSVHLITSDQLNTYDVLNSDDVVFTRSALDEFLAFAHASEAVEVDASGSDAPKAEASEAQPSVADQGPEAEIDEDADEDDDEAETAAEEEESK
jgi:large subunit ribosomal protein L4